MSRPVLKTVTRTQGNNAALKDGTISPDGFDLDFEEVPVLVQAFRRMVRGLEFDVCEMAITTYMCAREHGVRFTALPIFLVRGFHHGAILHHADAGTGDPGALEGKSVGVNRGYTVTTGVWARSVLQEEYGVDLSKVTWVLTGDEHVQAYQPPPNVVPLPEGESMEALLASGELAAAINISSEDPKVQPMIPDPLNAGIASFQRTGVYPINHLVVIRDDVLAAHPEVAKAVFDAFAASKNLYMERLEAGKIEDPTAVDRLHMRVLELGSDPLPYGIEPNLVTLERLAAHATTQQILKKPVVVEELFAPASHRFVG